MSTESQEPYYVELHFLDFVKDEVIEFITTEWEERFAGNDAIGPYDLEVRQYTRPSVNKKWLEHYMCAVRVVARNQQSKQLIVKLLEDAHNEWVDEMSAPDVRVFHYSKSDRRPNDDSVVGMGKNEHKQ